MTTVETTLAIPSEEQAASPTDDELARQVADILLRHACAIGGPIQIINQLGRCIRVLALAKRIITDTRATYAYSANPFYARKRMAELIDDVTSASTIQSWVELGKKLAAQQRST